MSIDDDLQPQPSITEGDRALALFTDRYSFTRLLAERINDDPPGKEILFFHGAGGNGKSLLLKYLQKTICKRLRSEQWQQVKALPDAELAHRLETQSPTQYLPVPSALLDFGLTPLGEVQPKDRFYGLLLLRKALGESAAGNTRLRFPRYDFACIWYLSQKGKSLDEIKSLFPLNEIAGLTTTVADVVTGNPVGALLKALTDFGMQGWSEKLTLQLVKLGVDKATQAHIRGWDLDRELIDELPGLLAEDLNAAMAQSNAPQRIALFFDTHEAFWGAQRNQSREAYFFQDEWLRRLLRKLNLADGIVVVVAGRDQPQWPQAKAVKPSTEIPENYLQLKEVGHLAEGDARAYLNKVGISDVALQDSLITYASVNPQAELERREVHPLHLGLGTDVVLEAQVNGTVLSADDFATVPDFETKGEQLIERLLRYVNEDMRYAIHALSACRAFDREIYQVLGSQLNFMTDETTFRRLTNFSFVWQTEQRGENWYRIHDLLRRLDNASEVRQAHQVLAEHYQAQGEIEAIYHINRLDWSQGVHLWVGVFDEALKLSRYELCRALLDIRQELVIETPFKQGLVSSSEGQYYQNLALYDAAQREYVEAIAAYDQDLTSNSDNTATLNNKGSALKRRADLLATQAQYEAALGAYQQAIEAYDAALQRAPDDIQILNNKGNVLKRRADLLATQAQVEAALGDYQQAIEAYDAALQRAPDDINALNNKGNALQ
ncbi:MAG: tetratricopeptide repeat protein, partial [Cyanobacteria bacterium P01_H01_bin.152]